MEGPRCRLTNLWEVPIPISSNRNQENHLAYSAYQQRTTAELQAYHHASLCGPTVATLINAIKNNRLTTFPDLTATAVRRHLPKSIQTSMGHLHQYRQGIRSTKRSTVEELMKEDFEEDIKLEPPR